MDQERDGDEGTDLSGMRVSVAYHPSHPDEWRCQFRMRDREWGEGMCINYTLKTSCGEEGAELHPSNLLSVRLPGKRGPTESEGAASRTYHMTLVNSSKGQWTLCELPRCMLPSRTGDSLPNLLMAHSRVSSGTCPQLQRSPWLKVEPHSPGQPAFNDWSLWPKTLAPIQVSSEDLKRGQSSPQGKLRPLS